MRGAVVVAHQSARGALAEGNPKLAKQILDEAPRCDFADLASERTRLLAEVERQLRGR